MKVQTEDICKQEFENLKFRKTDSRFIVFNIVNEKIVIERIGERKQTWATFVQSLPSNQYRYCVFDFEFTNQDKMNITKLIFVSWSPDEAPTKKRMIYATAKQSFKLYLNITKEISLSSKGDMNEAELIKELSK